LLPLAYSEDEANIVDTLRKIIDSPIVDEAELTRLKKDIFHAFHMLSLNQHDLRAQFCLALRDHLMRWDPVARKNVDEVCHKSFGISFDVTYAFKKP
jgi:hypothetical protein